jgi:hypothetical protein
MYERANYFKNKFIRNGIAGFAILIIIIFSSITNGELPLSRLIIFSAAAFLWLSLGLWINKNIKAKIATIESENIKESVPFQQIENIFTVFLFALLFLSFKNWENTNYLLFPVAIVYLYWLFTQMKLLNMYFKAS